MIFCKVREVKDPVFDYTQNAGIDVYVPTYNTSLVEAILSKNSNMVDEDVSGRSNVTEKGIYLLPGDDVCIPSGLKCRLDGPDMCLKVDNKSGVALKQKLICGATIIDYSYTGEIHIHVINYSNKPTLINFDQKIVQLLPIKLSVPEISISTSEAETFKDFQTSRGAGGFGSTGLS